MVTEKHKGHSHKATPYVWDKVGQNGMGCKYGRSWRGMLFVELEKLSPLKDTKDLDEWKEKKKNRPLLNV